MNYRHSFHAGNFADILKHLIFIAAINRLNKNQTPYTILDLYAGRGLCDLQGSDAQKTNEYVHGIEALQHHYKGDPAKCSDLIAQYMQILSQFNDQDAIMHYPGSPLIAASMLAGGSKLHCSELHPDEFQMLRTNLKKDNVGVHNLSAYDMLDKSLPLLQNQSLLLIDSAFEVMDEFARIIDLCYMIEEEAPSSTVLIWYPIKNMKSVQQYTSDLKNLYFKDILRVTISIPKQLVKKSYNGEDGLYQCGVDIINPGDLAENLKPSMKILEGLYTPQAKIMMTYL